MEKQILAITIILIAGLAYNLVIIAMPIYGIFILIKGRFPVGKKKVLTNKPARLCGAILILPIPLTLLIGIIFATPEALGLAAVISVFGALIPALILGKIIYKKQKK